MDLTPQYLRAALGLVDLEGWDSESGRALLEHARRSVVVPVVRRSGLRGPAADQAEATGWAAAWDALRRPSARTAENPGGMVWVAVRRAVASERGDGSPRLSLERLTANGWEPGEPQVPTDPAHGPVVAMVVDALVEFGWDRMVAGDAVAMLAETSSASRVGSPSTRWRWVSLRLGVPEWQARRLAGLLLGDGGWPGVLELAVVHGPGVMGDEVVRAAVRATSARWSAGPGAWLAGWGSPSVECEIA